MTTNRGLPGSAKWVPDRVLAAQLKMYRHLMPKPGNRYTSVRPAERMLLVCNGVDLSYALVDEHRNLTPLDKRRATDRKPCGTF
jgi:hypothetical protein